jgi:hypothetical protein
MKRFMIAVFSVGIILTANGLALGAIGFYAYTNEIGYQGTIWNVTDGTGPWQTATPRDASLYVTKDAPHIYSDYNQLLSNWYEHHLSNQNDSFLQISDTMDSVTSASGGWDPTLTVFTVTVSGADAPYPWSRFWQPDNGVAWGVTITDYTYSFTATFDQAAAVDPYGWLSNTIEPSSITGSFTGQFVVTADVDKNPITNGDRYGFDINFSKASFADLDPLNADGGPTSVYNGFGVGPIPEPTTIIIWSLLGGLGIVFARLRRGRKDA